jgi:transcription-repair coupling factor (superfamily II helicase)
MSDYQTNTALFLEALQQSLPRAPHKSVYLSGLQGSLRAVLAHQWLYQMQGNHVFIFRNAEESAYFLNDLQALGRKDTLYFPASYHIPYQAERTQNINWQYRAEALTEIQRRKSSLAVVTYHEALYERVVTQKKLSSNSYLLEKGKDYDIDFLNDFLQEYHFQKVDFVFQPGQFSVRGGILDIFSFAYDDPFRVVFQGDTIESIRSFDAISQLSKEKLPEAKIVPNLETEDMLSERESFFDFLGKDTTLWFLDTAHFVQTAGQFMQKAENAFASLSTEMKHLPPADLFLGEEVLKNSIKNHPMVHWGLKNEENLPEIHFPTKPQPSFQKNIDGFLEEIKEKSIQGYKIYIASGQKQQIDRIFQILEDKGIQVFIHGLEIALNEGFIVETAKIACYTDHQIFGRFHRFRLKENLRKTAQAISLKEIFELQKGDFVSHIDHGVGRFSGLETLDVNGRKQEAIRLVYQGGDVLYVSIHALHKISKFSAQDAQAPTMHKLGSSKWTQAKERAKKKIKELAFDLIALYAKRKSAKGHAFVPDGYLQHAFEASFEYEDTPDQTRITAEIKKDMESQMPMDRLVCGDVGFGKTELAMRAAFKAVCDGKQVAILVPTTVLCYQHYRSFARRMADFPLRVDYVNRFKSKKDEQATLKDLAEGKVDILVGTHKLAGKSVQFKDLGLLIIDEEQKFGVAVKEKLKTLKTNIDVLTLTATPIPRTLQFSLMGARDLSVLETPPQNRQSVETQILEWDESTIRDAIALELQRSGQVYFINNRIENLLEVAGALQRLLPDARIGIGHGQMDGEKLEEVLLDFMDGNYDILVATRIIENGIDVPNANTIFINGAQNFGLSELHQMRGRVGRSQRKAFCYLLAPPFSTLTDDARRRLETLAYFSDLGSGFQIAMKDLDIRGAGNVLGGEQSGFITEIGFDMYQKILAEALQELKQNEYKDLFQDQQETKTLLVKECVLESDLEMRLPEEYVQADEERLLLYQNLSKCKTSTELEKFTTDLIDRFGTLPKVAKDLLDSVRLQQIAAALGFEKISLKMGKCIGTWTSDGAYFQSDTFMNMMQILHKNPKTRIDEKNGKARLVVQDISTLKQALDLFSALLPNKN